MRCRNGDNNDDHDDDENSNAKSTAEWRMRNVKMLWTFIGIFILCFLIPLWASFHSQRLLIFSHHLGFFARFANILFCHFHFLIHYDCFGGKMEARKSWKRKTSPLPDANMSLRPLISLNLGIDGLRPLIKLSRSSPYLHQNINNHDVDENLFYFFHFIRISRETTKMRKLNEKSQCECCAFRYFVHNQNALIRYFRLHKGITNKSLI